MLQHIVRATDLSTKELRELFANARRHKERGESSGLLRVTDSPVEGHNVVLLFYQPSTRTRGSFDAAVKLLGGTVTATENAGEFSSAVKGETLEDSIRVMGGYGSAIVLRHPEIGAAARAARVSSVPIINAGDGMGEHPTQAFLDLFTIIEETQGRDDLTITLVGDLKRGRTIHSLVRLICSCNEELLRVKEVRLVAPVILPLPQELENQLRSCVPYLQTRYESWCSQENNLSREMLEGSHIVYVTRPQNEHGVVLGSHEQWKLTRELAACLPEDAAILHPLPRNSELPPEIDADPRARYFQQAQNGLFVRMALLEMLLGPRAA